MSDITSEILAMSCDGLTSPRLHLTQFDAQHGTHPLGWGLAWYPEDSRAAQVQKDPSADAPESFNRLMDDWESFRSTVFLGKFGGSAKGYTHHETQPFSRSFAGKHWLFMHNGDLDRHALAQLHTNDSRFLEPLGRTDSELAFVYLLGKMQESDARTLSDVPFHTLHGWLQELDALGSADMCISDGVTLIAFLGTKTEKSLKYWRIQPPNRPDKLQSPEIELLLDDSRDTHRTAVIFSSADFEGDAWEVMQSGQMVVARMGNVVWSSAEQADAPQGDIQIQTDMQHQQAATSLRAPEPEPATEMVMNVRSITHAPDGRPLAYRLYDLTHVTEYRYDSPVQHSTHTFRLQPEEDHLQEVVHAKVALSVAGEEVQYQDVFGNHAIHYTITKPYTCLRIESTARVKLFELPPDDHSPARRRTNIPLVWMPSQRQMMAPYLMPMELPESQLEELTTYAMSFVERNSYHLLDTLEDINLSIYRDYRYIPGSTSVSTTPFEVYANRAGVCQDFANLFMCLARLLGVPARYRVGYIHTGANYANKIQSEASHAWVEVYLPYVGWRGYDPTNGCLVAQDHIRVAAGRNYRDTAPTSGTIYQGGSNESLHVDVKLEQVTG